MSCLLLWQCACAAIWLFKRVMSLPTHSDIAPINLFQKFRYLYIDPSILLLDTMLESFFTLSLKILRLMTWLFLNQKLIMESSKKIYYFRHPLSWLALGLPGHVSEIPVLALQPLITHHTFFLRGNCQSHDDYLQSSFCLQFVLPYGLLLVILGGVFLNNTEGMPKNCAHLQRVQSRLILTCVRHCKSYTFIEYINVSKTMSIRRNRTKKIQRSLEQKVVNILLFKMSSLVYPSLRCTLLI